MKSRLSRKIRNIVANRLCCQSCYQPYSKLQQYKANRGLKISLKLRDELNTYVAVKVPLRIYQKIKRLDPIDAARFYGIYPRKIEKK